MGSGLNEQFEALFRGTNGPSEPEYKIALSRLSVELKHRFVKGSPESFEFVASAVRALARIRGIAHAEMRMTCLWDSGSFLFSNGFDVEALECAVQLGHLAEQTRNKSWLRKAHTLRGIAYAHLGDSGEAVLQYAQALELARETEDLEGEAAILNNLGLALNYAGLYREAIPCFVQAISVAKKLPDSPTSEAAALCNLAQSYFHLGEYRDGLQTIALCLEKSEEPLDAFQALGRVVREFTFVQLALELGKLGAARFHSQACQRYSQRSGTKRSKFVAGVSWGLCEIHGGDVDKGLALLEDSLRVSGETGTPEHASALKALVSGYDHASRPEQALSTLRLLLKCIREGREKGLLALVSLQSQPHDPLLIFSENADLQTFTNREAHLRAQVAEREIVNSRVDMLERFAVTADLKEEASGEHGYRVGRLASLFARDLGWSAESCLAIDLAARLHDIGKLAVPDRIVLNSEELREAERHFMSAHTVIGAELLSKSNIPQLRMAEEIARFHHEWWNGQGYPSRLAGKRIPIHARIVALADVFDALTHGRPFSKPWPMDQAIEEIRSRGGTQFDPDLTEMFLALIRRLREEHDDLDEYLGRAGRSSPFLQARNKIRLMLADERENERMATVEGNETRH